MESRMIVQQLLLTPGAQEMRKERCRKLLNKLKASPPHQVQVFSNEKIFTRDVAINHCNLTDLPVTYVNPASASLPSPRLLRSRWSWGRQMVTAKRVQSFSLALAKGSTPRFVRAFCRSTWSPGSRGCIQTATTSSKGFHAGSHHQDNPRVPYLSDLNPLDFFIRSTLQKKV